MILLTEEEILEIIDNYPVSHGQVAKAQLKKVVEELEERAEVEHEHCDNSCAHRGVSIWFDIYDWQALKKECDD